MADQKEISVTVAGSGRSYDVPVAPGDQPDDILWEVVDDEGEYELRRGNDETLDPDVDIHDAVEDGEALYATTQPVVG